MEDINKISHQLEKEEPTTESFLCKFQWNGGLSPRTNGQTRELRNGIWPPGSCIESRKNGELVSRVAPISEKTSPAVSEERTLFVFRVVHCYAETVTCISGKNTKVTESK